MIFGGPVRGTIGLAASDPDPWFRSQPFGCTGFSWEPPLGSCAHYHRGVDVARGPAGCGDDLLAVQAGTVIFAGKLIGGSKAVVIRHAGGFATGQSHMASLAVKAGAKVRQGTKIGTMGKTGAATGCHTHLALKTGFPASGDVNDFYLDKVGKWADIWPRLAQNVTVHPDGATVNLRTTPGKGATKGPVYAQSKSDGRIHRDSDDADLGATNAWRDWHGTVTGATYEGRSDWHAMELAIPGGKPITVYVAAKYAVLSSD